MKHFAALSFLLVFFVFGANAQCTPDASITTPGFYPAPDSLPCVERGIAFDTVLQFKNYTTIDPAAFGFPQLPVTITVNWVRVDSIAGLPSGLTYACSPVDCQFPGGSNGCISFTGTTNDAAGLYNLTIFATVNVDVPGFGNGIEQGGTSDDLGFPVFLNVIDSGAPCPAPTVEIANGPFYACAGGGGEQINLFIDTAGGVPPFTYAWTPAAGLNDATLASPTASPSVTTTYTVTVSDANGFDFSTTATVYVSPEADFDFTVNNSVVTFTNQSVGNTSNSWSFGNGNASTSANPTYDYEVDSTFEVTLIVTNDCGSDTITKTLTTTVGINGLDNQSLAISVFPNPTEGMFTVTANGVAAQATQVLVYDMQGRQVSDTALQSNGSTMSAIVDLSGNGSGIYIVKILSGSQTSTHKVVVH